MTNWTFVRSSVGRKTLVAVTGVGLLGFVIAHLLGNLLVLGGPHLLNDYAVHLRNLGPALWVARLVLLAAVITHIVLTIQLARENRRARGVAYAARRTEVTSRGAKTMVLSGLTILAFVIYHLLHFTFRVTHPSISHLTDAAGRHDVYSMVVLSFRDWRIAAAYVAAIALLCLHLGHGIGSFFQSMGWNDAASRRMTGRAGRVVALVLFLGYSTIPLAIALGLIAAPARSVSRLHGVRPLPSGAPHLMSSDPSSEVR